MGEEFYGPIMFVFQDDPPRCCILYHVSIQCTSLKCWILFQTKGVYE